MGPNKTRKSSHVTKLPQVARDEMKVAVLEALRELVSEGHAPQDDAESPSSARTPARTQRKSGPPPALAPRVRREVERAPVPLESPAKQVSFTRHAMQSLADAELTPQEVRIAVMVLQGLTNEQISQEAELSQKTVKHHIGAIFRKFSVDSRAQLSARIFPV